MAKIFLIDDHPVVRRGLVSLIEQTDDLAVCGEASDELSAVSGIAEAHPDLAIVDLSLGGVDGLQLIKEIRARFPKVLVLVLSMLDEVVYAERALRAGAQGYVSKKESPDHLLEEVRKLIAGHMAVSGETASRMIRKLVSAPHNEERNGLHQLTDRQLQVFELIGAGLSPRQIAGRLHVSVKTIDSHRANIKNKLGLTDSRELDRQAADWVRQGQGL